MGSSGRCAEIERPDNRWSVLTTNDRRVAEDHKGSYIVRVFNPTAKTAKGKLILSRPVKKAWLTNLNEDRREKIEPTGNTIPLSLGKKKVATLEFQT